MQYIRHHTGPSIFDRGYVCRVLQQMQPECSLKGRPSIIGFAKPIVRVYATVRRLPSSRVGAYSGESQSLGISGVVAVICRVLKRASDIRRMVCLTNGWLLMATTYSVVQC